MRNFYYLTSSNSQRWDADCYIYLRAKIRGTSLMEIWNRGRDSNSHNRSCSTTHNLSVTTRVITRICSARVAPSLAYLARSRNNSANGETCPSRQPDQAALRLGYHSKNRNNSTNGETCPSRQPDRVRLP